MRKKANKDDCYLTVRFSSEEREKLAKLARDSSRSLGGVIRRLLYLADTQAGNEALGIKGGANEIKP